MAPTSSPSGRNVRVLIADGHLSSALALKELFLSHAGLDLDVSAVADGYGALAVGEAELPDLVILAEGLPTMTAVDLATNLKRRRTGGHLPLVVFLAGDRQTATAAKLSGRFDLVMLQPVDAGLLLDLVRSAI